jgi:predicted  nucleic acid-binding Zn-ribbon protein
VDLDKTKIDSKTIDVTLPQQPHRTPLIWPWILGGALALSLVANLYQSSRTNHLNSDMNTLRQEIAGLKTSMNQSQEAVKLNLATVQENLNATKEEVSKKVDQARYVAQRSAAVVDAKFAKQVAERDKKLDTDLAQIRETTQQSSDKLASGLTAANGDIGAVKTDVGSVKADVSTARAELERTISDLKRMRGDMGEMSGLIATNAHELSALRELGDRVYWDFSLPKNGSAQKVGDVQLVLKKLDPKHNRYTVEVVMDDKHIEKKDRTINEPVQFYSGARQRHPLEVVVYQIDKDKVVGYLAAPKVQVARN